MDSRTPARWRRLRSEARRWLVALVVVLLVVALVLVTRALEPKRFPAPSWVDTVGPVALSSPATGVIGGVPVVAFGSENGDLYVVDAHNGKDLPGWPQPVDISAGHPSAIESSPTFAYLDGPSKPPSIVVGAGSTYVADQQGGLIAFNANGSVRFVFHTHDAFDEWHPGKPDRYDNSVFSTPAIGDITGDGEDDIVFGSYDHRLYALTADGHLVKGFPVDNEDTIWSSPALYHLRGPSDLDDIVIGSDASGRNDCFGGFLTDYSYRHGAPYVVWQHCENQTIWSSPAIGVINPSGRPAVVVGTGFGEPPPYKSASYRLFAFYATNGAPLPGWPVDTAGPAFGSPAIGTLAGSATPAVVDTSWCTSCTRQGGASMVYAFSGNGKRLWSQTLPGPNDFSSPVIADLSGSGADDVVVGSAGGLYALSGATGGFLYHTSASQPINTHSMLNSVAVEDVPGSGWQLFEACGGPKEVTSTGYLYDYPLPAAPVVAPPWPMWRGEPPHDGVAAAQSHVVPAARG